MYNAPLEDLSYNYTTQQETVGVLPSVKNVNSQNVILKNINLAKFQPKPTKQQKVGPKNEVNYTELLIGHLSK